MTDIQTKDDSKINIEDIARPVMRLDDLTDQHLADPRIQRMLHKLNDGSDF